MHFDTPLFYLYTKQTVGIELRMPLIIRLPLLCLLPITLWACPLPKIAGITKDVLHNVHTSFSALKPALCNHDLSIKTKEKMAETATKKALKPFGYFTPTLRWTHTPDWTVHIQPGPPLLIINSTLTITGPGKQRLSHLNTLPLIPNNQRLDTHQYQQIKLSLLTKARAAGYLDARVNHSYLSLTPDKYIGYAHFVLETGPHSVFGKISWDTSPLSSDFLRKFIHFSPGSSFSTQALDTLQYNLSNYGYFSKIQVLPQPNQHRSVPIHIKLTPAAPHQYLLGMGYDSDNGLQILTGVKWRYLNPQGHQLKFSTRLGNNDSRFTLNYLIPYPNPLHDKINLEATIQTQLKQPSGESHFVNLSAHFWHHRKHSRYHASLSHTREHSFPINEPSFVSHLLYPEFEWIYSKQHIGTVSYSSRFNTLIRASNKHFISSLSFTQWKINGQYHLGTGKLWQLWLSGSLGQTYSTDELPLSLQFYAGGAQSLRGYAYRSIGPNKTLQLSSLSILRAIKPHWYASAFVDVGNVSSHFTRHLKKSAGLGLVWQFPVGSARLSIAHPIHDQGSWRLHLSFIQT